MATNHRIAYLRCPECGQQLGEFLYEGRATCATCGCEVIYRSKRVVAKEGRS